MKINSVNGISTYKSYNNTNTLKSVSFWGLERYDTFVKSADSKEQKVKQKSVEIGEFVKGVDLTYKDTKKSGRNIMASLNRALRTGKKVNYQNYKAKCNVEGQEAKLVFNNFHKTLGIPKTISFVEPHELKTLMRYDMDGVELFDANGFVAQQLCIKFLDNTQDSADEYLLDEKGKVIARSEQENGSDIEKCIMPFKKGYHYMEARVSNNGSMEPEQTIDLSVSFDKKDPYKRYVEFDGDKQTVYNYDFKAKLWVKEENNSEN